MIKNYLRRHSQVLFGTLGKMAASPLAQIFTITVIAIAITLPVVFYLAVTNVARVSSGWDGRPQISVFLKMQINSNQAVALGRSLMAKPVIDDIQYIAPEQAIQQFQQTSGFGDLLSQLDHNPIPPLLVVFPDAAIDTAALELLVESLQQLSVVDSVVYDQMWLQRLSAILDLVRNGIAILACMMAFGVLLVVSNTVRLSIAENSREIEIIDQIGGTHAFIRRPFLYLGALQGAFGSAAAIVLVWFVLHLIGRPVSTLSTLYDSSFKLTGVDLSAGLILLAGSTFLGWSAAWLSVHYHFTHIGKER